MFSLNRGIFQPHSAADEELLAAVGEAGAGTPKGAGTDIIPQAAGTAGIPKGAGTDKIPQAAGIDVIPKRAGTAGIPRQQEHINPPQQAVPQPRYLRHPARCPRPARPSPPGSSRPRQSSRGTHRSPGLPAGHQHNHFRARNGVGMLQTDSSDPRQQGGKRASFSGYILKG